MTIIMSEHLPYPVDILHLQNNPRKGNGIMINLSTQVTPIVISDASIVRRILGEMVEVSCLNRLKLNGQKIRGLDKRTFHNAMIVMKNIEHILTT